MEEKNLTALWVIIALVVVALALGGLTYYFFALQSQQLAEQRAAIMSLQDEIADEEKGIEMDDGIMEEEADEEEESRYNKVDREMYSYEYKNGWHVDIVNKSARGESTIISSEPIFTIYDAGNIYEVIIEVSPNSGDDLDEAVEELKRGGIKLSEDVTVAGLPAKKVYYDENTYGGEQIAYIFVTDTNQYMILFNLTAIGQDSLGRDYRHIVESFKVN